MLHCQANQSQKQMVSKVAKTKLKSKILLDLHHISTVKEPAPTLAKLPSTVELGDVLVTAVESRKKQMHLFFMR
jgi:hypothetical protein